MGKRVIPPGGGDRDDGPGGEVLPVNLRDALEERYLAYALSTIMHRALPDVRDGLKPVHRRLLYAMRELRLDPGAAFKKCARVVGDVIGKYHPHGDVAVYDAMARLAQDFSQRYPLVDGQGNFGNIDGDNPAAMRYTEARLTDVAALILEGLDEDSVDFRATYDGSEEEPTVLPGAFPNLLANGSNGIAVGMATSIPPHNAHEVCRAALKLIEAPDTPIEQLVELVPGPDFPTGGVIVESRSSILESYRTGRGGFRLRARWAVEDLGRGTWVVVVTEIPYQVAKSRLIEKLADLINDRKVPLLEDVRDESTQDVRVVLVPKSRNASPELMMESLFKLTELECRISLNMNVLSQGVIPNVLGLKDVLVQWLDHQKTVLVRRSEHRLAAIVKRLEILGGLLVAYLNIDEVIHIIRTEDEPKPFMMARFAITDVQAQAILDMRLKNLRKLEEFEIRKEHDALTAEAEQIRALLASEERQWKIVAASIRRVAAKYGPETPLGKRRTSFADAPEHDTADIMEAMIEREPITVVVSDKGWVRTLKGHIDDFSRLEFKQGDKLRIAFKAETTDKLLVFSTGGRFYTLEASKLPGGRGQGEPIRLQCDMDQDQDVLDVFVHAPTRRLLVAGKDGRGFVVAESDMVAQTRKGKQVLNLGAADEARICVEVPDGATHVAVIGDNRKLLVFPLDQVPVMTRGSGVRLQRYRDGGIAAVKCFVGATGLTWTGSAGRSFTRSLAELKDWLGNRGDAGRLPPAGFPKTNRFDNA
ncbi:DNA topoisomerase IV subunit A [Siculibacillus lacustris]|uniref:DNA topoisomerase 4 subunit A n=1 Tax=Siculibacillus lacustris TaxID=1549641 RepID=A0A4Q9VX76_9HYPH|nr:DNA topoisomerase IV subunit A [Siculibacillus lacustris]TBW39739.1 DNA topoisomerase IV subunit A [Siculibacillus lacustris]